MSLSKNIRHYRTSAVVSCPKRYIQAENSTSTTGETEEIAKMSVRNLTNSHWKVVNIVRDFVYSKVKTPDFPLELNKELAVFLQKIKPSIYGSKIIRDFGSKAITQEPNKIENQTKVQNKVETITKNDSYKLQNMFNQLGFGNSKETSGKEAKISTVPNWKQKQQNLIISKSSISSRTSHIITMIATAESEESLLKRIQALSEHLSQFPDAKNQAVKGGAIRVLLRIRENRKSEALQATICEAFARLGHVDPPLGRGIRILSIDGGGIRGLVVIDMLKKIEELTGKKIYELFDYVCGVSTGAILTTAIIANKRSLEESSKYYKELSTQIFTQNALLGTSNLVLKQAYYDTGLWEKMLKEYLGEVPFIKTAQDQRCPKLSTVSAVVNQSQISAYLFRNYALPYRVCSQYMGSSDCAVWQAARASAAAPTYFEEFMLDGLLHQDGGIMVNNPTAIAIHEAKQLWPGHPIQCVLSFGTGRASPIAHDSEDNSTAASSSWKNKFLKILDSATDTEGVHTVLSDLLEPHVYYRFNPYLTEYLSMVEIRPEKLKQMEQDCAMYLRRNEEKFEKAAKQLTLQRLPSQKLADWAHKQQIILGVKSAM
ncbi:calcium-independent phospholipase A2-gamma-like isoform X2 [Chrysoperla carnea]|uniref:calcium-independent phospholipase A2-gamma-like isoform X2 n=1 Tax=Chrysoperla carnea TaxID=189513 RepID=UPI001D064992|nr:calcium-independent phospholipase A2-gamma-like isoform X2 [Chrysoperla carnea]